MVDIDPRAGIAFGDQRVYRLATRPGSTDAARCAQQGSDNGAPLPSPHRHLHLMVMRTWGSNQDLVAHLRFNRSSNPPRTVLIRIWYTFS